MPHSPPGTKLIPERRFYFGLLYRHWRGALFFNQYLFFNARIVFRPGTLSGTGYQFPVINGSFINSSYIPSLGYYVIKYVLWVSRLIKSPLMHLLSLVNRAAATRLEIMEPTWADWRMNGSCDWEGLKRYRKLLEYRTTLWNVCKLSWKEDKNTDGKYSTFTTTLRKNVTIEVPSHNKLYLYNIAINSYTIFPILCFDYSQTIYPTKPAITFKDSIYTAANCTALNFTACY